MSKFEIGDKRPYLFYPGDLVEINYVEDKDKNAWFAENFWKRKIGKIGIVIESYWHDDNQRNHHIQIFLQDDAQYHYLNTEYVKKI